MKQIKPGEYRNVLFIATAGILIYSSYAYWNYIMIAKSIVPIMDYWHWIAVYGESILNDTIRFRDYFFSDVGEHIQPLAMMLQFGVLKASDFDVQPLVTWGAAARIVFAIGMFFVFLWCHRHDLSSRLALLILFAFGIFGSVINYNQWEMTTEPFSLATMMRTSLYYLSFGWMAWFLAAFQRRSYKANLIHGALLGGYCAFLTVFVGAAYFVGHLPAIGIVFVIVFFSRWEERKQYFFPFLIWAMISFAGALTYYWLISLGGRSHRGSTPYELWQIFLFLLEAVSLFWSAFLLPQTLVDTTGIGLYYMLGILTVLYSGYILIRYLKLGREKNMFPVVCLLYATIVAAAIGWGRIETFSVSTMLSSRYVVESSIGFVGILWMTYDVFLEKDRGTASRIKGMLLILAVLLLLNGSAQKEQGIAPYRKIYNEDLAVKMQNIDDYGDEELSVFQAGANDVRYCVAFFKENYLSIFSRD